MLTNAKKKKIIVYENIVRLFFIVIVILGETKHVLFGMFTVALISRLGYFSFRDKEVFGFSYQTI